MSEISRDTEEHQRVRTGGGHQDPAFLTVVFFPELMPGYLKCASNILSRHTAFGEAS